MVTKLNIKKEIFTCKDHYLAFRQAWKDYINAGKHKPEWVDIPFSGKVKHSNLNGAQHLLFNILAEKDLAETFKPSNKEGKDGFGEALRGLYSLKYKIKRLQEEKPSHMTEERFKSIQDGNEIIINEFLEPFGPCVTIDMVSKVLYKLDKLSNVNEIEKAA